MAQLAGEAVVPTDTAAEAPVAVAPPLTTRTGAILNTEDNRRSQQRRPLLPPSLLPLEPATIALPASTVDLLGSGHRFDLHGLRRRRSFPPCPTARPCPRCCPIWQVSLRVDGRWSRRCSLHALRPSVRAASSKARIWLCSLPRAVGAHQNHYCVGCSMAKCGNRVYNAQDDAV